MTETPTVVRALSTKEAAARLGVTTYTVNEWCRLGLLGFRQDTPGGRRHFSEGDLAAYEAAHHAAAVAKPVADSYSPAHDSRGIPQGPALARVDASRGRRGARGNQQHGRAMGAGGARRKPARATRPFSPGAGAWSKPPEPSKG